MSEQIKEQETVEQTTEQSNQQPQQQTASNETNLIELKKYIDIRLDEIVSKLSKADNVDEKVETVETRKEIEW